MGKVGAEGGPWVTVRGVAIREASREPDKSAEPRRGWGAAETRSGVRAELCRSLGRPASERTQLGQSGESDRPVKGGKREGGRQWTSWEAGAPVLLWGLGWPGPGSGQGGWDKQPGSGGLLRLDGGGCRISWWIGKTVCSRRLSTDSHVSKPAERMACYLPRWVRSRRGGGGSPGAPFVRRFVMRG